MQIFTRFTIGSVAMFCALGVAKANTLYVDLSNPNPSPPFSSWATAATNIQDAVDASVDGDLVLVTNGIYATGGRMWFDSGTNRVTITNAITLQSVNGPEFTRIVGHQVSGTGPALTNAARCVYMGDSAVLSGFTLTNGEAGFGNYPSGGGVIGGIVTNCVIVGNLATNSAGGGAYRSTLIDCQLVGNSATRGGGACACALIGCNILTNLAFHGGGAYGDVTYGTSVLTNCVLAGNSAIFEAGGAFGGTLTRCSITNNRATYGGGVYNSTLTDCVLSANSAPEGGGAYQSTLYNSILSGNRAGSGGGGYLCT